jgi:hypothetical protein
MKVVFEQVMDGEEFEVPKEWYISCCHCGLVHCLTFRDVSSKRGKKLMLRVDMEIALTRARRRELGVKVVKTKPSRGKIKKQGTEAQKRISSGTNSGTLKRSL